MSLRRRLRWYRVFGFIVIAVIGALALGGIAPAEAHPADMYLHVHTVTLTPDGLRLDWSIAPGPMLSFVVWDQADADGDGAVTPDEALAWGEPLVAEFFAVLDTQARLDLTLEAVEWPGSLVEFELGNETIVLHLAGAWSLDAAAGHQLALYNRYEEITSINWFYLSAEDGVQFATPDQQSALLQVEFILPGAPDDALSAAPDALRDYWDSGQPALAMGGQAVEPPKPGGSEGPVAELSRLLRDNDQSAAFYLTAFAIALGLGAVHALTPGHGKALVGAYLVGARGTIHHAIALGSIVTLTHTGSVLALGALTLAASHILMPTTVFPVLEIASGLLVVGMGLGLMYRRWQAWQSVRQARQRLEAADRPPQTAPQPVTVGAGTVPVQTAISGGGTGSTVTESAPASGGGSRTRRIQIDQPIRANVYNDVLPGSGDLSLGGVNWRSLVALGVSGGLVPCPDAIAILLVAVAINRIVLGLSLIVAFSLGLAGILTAIGIAMVRSQRLLSRFKSFDRMVPALPLFSALVVTGLGIGLTVQAIQRPGFLGGSEDSTDRLELTVGSESGTTDINALLNAEGFRIDRASFLLLATDSANRYQLYVGAAAGGEPLPLTDEPFGVWDYRLSPDGTTIAYSAPQEFGGSDIWAIDTGGGDRRQVIACPDAVCSRPVWSPDGTRLVYERLEMATSVAPVGVTSLWWAEVDSGETGPVFQDSQLPGISPAWSPDGAWLAYLSPSTSRVQLYNLLTGDSRAVPSQTGGAVVWHPDGESLLVTDLWSAGEGEPVYTHLMQYDLDSGQLTDLTGERKVGDTWAAWSPDGKRLAVVRREYTGPDASLGDRVWIMDADGSDARPLTDTPDVVHGLPVWSPDGGYLLFRRYPLAGSGAEPGVWLLNVATRELRQVAMAGDWPAWVP